MPTLGQFGDVFLFQEDEYVFLGSTPDVIYAAKILSKVLTQKVLERDDKMAKRATAFKSDGERLFCYTVLTTPPYVGQAAHMGRPDSEQRSTINFTGQQINSEDQRCLRDKILDESSNLPLALKNNVRELDIA